MPRVTKYMRQVSIQLTYYDWKIIAQALATAYRVERSNEKEILRVAEMIIRKLKA